MAMQIPSPIISNQDPVADIFRMIQQMMAARQQIAATSAQAEYHKALANQVNAETAQKNVAQRGKAATVEQLAETDPNVMAALQKTNITGLEGKNLANADVTSASALQGAGIGDSGVTQLPNQGGTASTDVVASLLEPQLQAQQFRASKTGQEASAQQVLQSKAETAHITAQEAREADMQGLNKQRIQAETALAQAQAGGVANEIKFRNAQIKEIDVKNRNYALERVETKDKDYRATYQTLVQSGGEYQTNPRLAQMVAASMVYGSVAKPGDEQLTDKYIKQLVEGKNTTLEGERRYVVANNLGIGADDLLTAEDALRNAQNEPGVALHFLSLKLHNPKLMPIMAAYYAQILGKPVKWKQEAPTGFPPSLTAPIKAGLRTQGMFPTG